MMLVVTVGSTTRNVLLDHFPFKVGRRTDSDLLIPDTRLSREHAQLLRESDGIYIVDLNSRHGTYVNGQRVSRQRLAEGDEIVFAERGSASAIITTAPASEPGDSGAFSSLT